jgi:hypothetical protein
MTKMGQDRREVGKKQIMVTKPLKHTFFVSSFHEKEVHGSAKNPQDSQTCISNFKNLNFWSFFQF